MKMASFSIHVYYTYKKDIFLIIYVLDLETRELSKLVLEVEPFFYEKKNKIRL